MRRAHIAVIRIRTASKQHIIPHRAKLMVAQAFSVCASIETKDLRRFMLRLVNMRQDSVRVTLVQRDCAQGQADPARTIDHLDEWMSP